MFKNVETHVENGCLRETLNNLVFVRQINMKEIRVHYKNGNCTSTFRYETKRLDPSAGREFKK